MTKRGCLGFSFPVLIGIVLILLVLFIVGLLAGPIGKGLMTKFGVSLVMPAWLNVPQPAVNLPAATVFHIFGLPITNSVVASWLTIVVVVLFCYAATRRMRIVPGRLQAFFEFIVGWIYDLCRNVAGEKNGRRFFPLVATIFLYVAFNAWLSLLPGFGSIELGEQELFRAANTDINTPLALALVSFVMVLYFGLKDIGPGYLRQYFNFGPFFHGLGQVFKGKLKSAFSGIFLGFIEIVVGLLELLSMFIRIISFTFRLFGNMTAGEILLLIAAFLLPWFFAIPFYGLELLVGFVQALIFGGLTLVFLTVAVAHHGSERA